MSGLPLNTGFVKNLEVWGVKPLHYYNLLPNSHGIKGFNQEKGVV